TLGVTGRYAGKSYLDNTNDDRFTTPSFFTLETNAAYSFAHGMRMRLQVNNALNNKRVWPSGYSYLFLTPQKTVDGISYYYPQATRNRAMTVEFAKWCLAGREIGCRRLSSSYKQQRRLPWRTLRSSRLRKGGRLE